MYSAVAPYPEGKARTSRYSMRIDFSRSRDQAEFASSRIQVGCDVEFSPLYLNPISTRNRLSNQR